MQSRGKLNWSSTDKDAEYKGNFVSWIINVTCGGQDDWKKNISYWLDLYDRES